MIIQTNQSVFSKKYSKRLNLAKKSIRKLELLIENQTSSKNSDNLDDFDSDDLLYIAHTSLWSSLEGFVNYLLKLMGFRNNDCELYFSTSSPENFYSLSKDANAAYILTSEKEIFYYNRTSLPSLEKIKAIDDNQFEQVNKLFDLNHTPNLSHKKITLISKKIPPKKLHKLKEIIGHKHKEIHSLAEKLDCLLFLINSISKQKLLKNILNRLLENELTFEEDKINVIDSLDAVKNIMLNFTANREGQIRNNNTHLNTVKLVKNESHSSLEEAEQSTNDFYSSTDFNAYLVYGLTTDLVKNTFSIFDGFIKKCTAFFKNHIQYEDISIQFEESICMDERLDRMQLHNLLVNTPHDIEVPLASGTTHLIEF
ncbi:TPA: hypothetical protein KKX52_002730 [Legionella pneumophila]|nr:hypothetical protein [Legionella pneumophila]